MRDRAGNGDGGEGERERPGSEGRKKGAAEARAEELNPESEIVQAVRDRWHILAAALILKFSPRGAVVTPADLQRLDSAGVIAVQEREDGIHLWIVSREEGERLVRETGGLVG